MYFCPFILDMQQRETPVNIELAQAADLNTQADALQWQTDWSSDYLTRSDFLLYAMKTTQGELVALGAYQLLPESIIVRIAYMESQPESNPTITKERDARKYGEIGRALIAFGIKLSVDNGFGGDVTFEAKTTELAEHYERDLHAIRLPDFDKNSAPRYLITGKTAQMIFSIYLRKEELK